MENVKNHIKRLLGNKDEMKGKQDLYEAFKEKRINQRRGCLIEADCEGLLYLNLVIKTYYSIKMVSNAKFLVSTAATPVALLQ